MHALRLLAIALLSITAPSLARAQVALSGEVYDGQGGPLLAGTVYHCAGGFFVPENQTLTAEPGAIVKFEGFTTTATIFGTLDVNGTAADPVIFTSIEDDSAGGDTNGNGNQPPAPGDWAHILFQPESDASTLDWFEARYGGGAFGAHNITLSGGADIRLSNCTARSGAASGLKFVGDAYPTVQSCNFVDNAAIAIDGPPLEALNAFSGNTASGNGGNYISTNGTSNSGDVLLAVDNLIDATVVSNGDAVSAGTTLTLEAGVVVKMSSAFAGLEIFGTLDVNGTSAAPVIITSFMDDSAAGDTNGDGPSSGSAGDWAGLNLLAGSGASKLDWLEARYGGANFGSNLVWVDSSPIFRNCTFRDSLSLGMLTTSNARPIVRSSSFLNNAGGALAVGSIYAVPRFSTNTSSGNGGSGSGYDALELRFATVDTGDVTINAANVLGGAIVLVPNLIVGTNDKLAFGEGVIVKMRGNSVSVFGEMVSHGTPDEPVVFTSLADDSIGGDTNLDGASTSPAPGDWNGLSFPTSSTGALSGTLVRYGGGVAVYSNSPSLALDGVRSDFAAGAGFWFDDLDSGIRLAAWNNAGPGFRLNGSTFDLSRLSSVANGSTGILKISSHTGQVSDAISWNNSSDNYAGFAPGELTYSNGDPNQAGANGNINSDPLFEDEAVGDLRLALGSPSIDTGDPNSTPDPDGTRADMGAYPSNQCAPTAYCTAKTGLVCGVPRIDFEGTPSTSQPSGFTVTAEPALGNRVGLLLYTDAGPAAIPFQGGFLCVQPPVRRTVSVGSGGTNGACDGLLSIDMNAFAQGSLGGNPEAFLKTPGTRVNVQWWGRDTIATGSYLSDALTYVLCQ